MVAFINSVLNFTGMIANPFSLATGGGGAFLMTTIGTNSRQLTGARIPGRFFPSVQSPLQTSKTPQIAKQLLIEKPHHKILNHGMISITKNQGNSSWGWRRKRIS